jgi:hypothetical protein
MQENDEKYKRTCARETCHLQYIGRNLRDGHDIREDWCEFVRYLIHVINNNGAHAVDHVLVHDSLVPSRSAEDHESYEDIHMSFGQMRC